jgi:hypothetical protein
MGIVKIFPFSQFDILTDQMKTSTRWGTEEAIDRIGGLKWGRGMIVDESVVLSDIEGFTERYFSPNRAFQRNQVSSEQL